MKESITVLLADDHTIVRQGLSLIVSQHEDIAIIGEATSGTEALAMVELHHPDVLVCDIAMPGMSGIEVARKLAAARSSTRVLFLTMQDTEEYIFEAMQVGTSGFLSKNAATEELVQAITKVAEGKEYFSESVYGKAFQALRHARKRNEIRLTPREKEVIQLLADGLSTKLIADKLNVSEFTISNHRANLLRKLEAHNVAELVRMAVEKGLVK
mgnify:CR=1 FL=1